MAPSFDSENYPLLQNQEDPSYQVGKAAQWVLALPAPSIQSRRGDRKICDNVTIVHIMITRFEEEKI